MNILENIKNKKITIVTHEATTGPSHDLRDFLLPYVKEITFIAHPLLYIPSTAKNSSRLEQYKNNKQTKKYFAWHWRLPEILAYGKDAFYTFWWVSRFARKTDVFVGTGNINAVIGILLKKIRLVKKVIFYSIDFVPNRFPKKILNDFYHHIDKFAAEKSDITWNLSPRMREGRKRKWNKDLGNQITVPIGIWYKRIVKNTAKKKNKNEIIYLGTLLEKQGIDICIEAVERIKKDIPDVHFTIIGSGPYENVLKQMVIKNKLQKYITFLGYLTNHEEVEKRLSMATIAVALYNPSKDAFSYYADPGKVKSYLACGLPILITDIPFVAKQVERERCGIIVDYKIEDITEKIKSFLKDEKKVSLYKKNALLFAKQYDWEIIFKQALGKSI